ncbi:hypothetical protein PR048_021289 [Dryococelus australis]|uniref:Uncharacterized protein n=1 Tax=Dryococelus australis TaxID=614101 RepID=A0ABQ9GXS4_9NEOP|nr:hypothetical protein PR048_021289 [Dryococelus australis]
MLRTTKRFKYEFKLQILRHKFRHFKSVTRMKGFIADELNSSFHTKETGNRTDAMSDVKVPGQTDLVMISECKILSYGSSRQSSEMEPTITIYLKKKIFLRRQMLLTYPSEGAEAVVIQRLECSLPSTRTVGDAPRFSHAGIAPGDAAVWRVFSGVSSLPHPYILALLLINLASPSSDLKTSLCRLNFSTLYSRGVPSNNNLMSESAWFYSICKLRLNFDQFKTRSTQGCLLEFLELEGRRFCGSQLLNYSRGRLKQFYISSSRRTGYLGQQYLPPAILRRPRAFTRAKRGRGINTVLRRKPQRQPSSSSAGWFTEFFSTPVTLNHGTITSRGHGGVVVRLLASHQGEAGFDSRRGHPPNLHSGNHAGRRHWLAGSLEDIPFPPPLRSGAAPYSLRSTLAGYQDIGVKSHPNISIHSLTQSQIILSDSLGRHSYIASLLVLCTVRLRSCKPAFATWSLHRIELAGNPDEDRVISRDHGRKPMTISIQGGFSMLGRKRKGRIS